MKTHTTKATSHNRSVILILAAAGVCACPPLRAAFTNFDNASDYSNNFTESNFTAGAQYTYSTSAGVGGIAGRVDFSTTGAESTIFSSAPFAGSAALSISGFFLTDNSRPNLAGNLGLVNLGFVNNPGGSFFNTAGDAFVAMSLNRVSPSNSLMYQWQGRNDPAGTGVETISDTPNTMTLLDAHWYKLSANFTSTAGNVFSVASTLEDFGTAGTSAPSTVGSFSVTFPSANPNVRQDPSVFGGFGASFTTPTAAIDNVNVVPEPASVGLLTAGFITLWLRRLRRNRNA